MPNMTLLAYGSRIPQNIKRSFETTIKIIKQEEQTTVYVVVGGTRNQLGKETATLLGVSKNLL